LRRQPPSEEYRFLEYAIESRFRYFNDSGFPANAFAKHQIGPVVVKGENVYKHELISLTNQNAILVRGYKCLVRKYKCRRHARSPVVDRIIRMGGELAAEVRSIILVRSRRTQNTRAGPGSCRGNRRIGEDRGLRRAVTVFASQPAGDRRSTHRLQTLLRIKTIAWWEMTKTMRHSAAPSTCRTADLDRPPASEHGLLAER
jgi:hypothetical protein